jgi:tRNA(fMet)-specific endonuclease VapC
VSISAVVLAELRFGIHASAAERRPGNLQALNDFLSMVAVHGWPAEAADLYGARRVALKAQGLPIGANDLLIGCHALHLGRVLVTQNLREFERLEGLRVESWVD